MSITAVLRILALTGASLGIGAAAEAKTLVYCSEASPETFNPLVGVADSTMDASAKTMFNRLIEMKPGTSQIEPALAERWEISEDGTSYTFHLRPGVKFHSNKQFKPTRMLNADDVVSSFTRQWKKDDPYHALPGKDYEFFDSFGLGSLIKSIDHVDDLTVRFVLNEPNAAFLADLALDFASILSVEYTKAMVAAGTPAAIDQEPIGTGPFVLTAYQKDSQIRFAANPDYWAGAPKVDLVFAITPDPTVRMAKLKAGECHVAIQPPPAAIEDLRKDPNITLLEGRGQNVGYLGFNVERKPLDDKRVRQALAIALDKKAIVDAIFQGAGTVAKTFIPPGELGSAQGIADRPHDPAAAKKLLADAGFPNGFTTTLWAGSATRGYNPNQKRMAELIQAQWAQIGVKASIVFYEWGDYLTRTRKGEQDAFLLGGTSDNGDPDNLATYFLSCEGAKDGSNRSRWCYKPYEDLLIEGRRVTDPAKRAEIYVKAQQIALDETPLAPIAHGNLYMPIRKAVKNYVLDLFGRQNFKNVDLAD